MARWNQTVEERFWSKVERGPACWVWTSTLNNKGYGVFYLAGKHVYAHRMAWFLTHGVMPDDFVCHRCDNPQCVRPDHLWLGSNSDNIHDSIAKGRFRTWNSTKTHCPHGHPYDEANTFYSSGKRNCRICRRAVWSRNNKRRWAEHKAKVPHR